MSNLHLMALGGHFFYVPLPDQETPNFDTFDMDSQFSWVAQGRLSRDPAMQFTGAGEEIVSINGRLFPHHFGGLQTLGNLRNAGREGKPLLLVRFLPIVGGAEGIPVGQYVITRVKRSESRIGITGIGHKVDFTLELKKYGEDPADATQFLWQGGQAT